MWAFAVSGRGIEAQPKRHTKVLYKVVVLARDAAAAKGSRSCQAVANALVLIYHSITCVGFDFLVRTRGSRMAERQQAVEDVFSDVRFLKDKA